jgi:outer membrane protein OmpA-like peptidoglycan-associated protein
MKRIAAPSFRSLFFSTAFLSLLPLAAQDESGDDLVKKLKGRAGQPEAGKASGGMTTRGMKTRSIGGGTTAPATASETRSLTMRGVPKAVSAAAEEDKVDIKPTAAGGDEVELSYKVDPESKVARDNILFRKGSAEFADDASVEVVVTLAEALKHPDLKGLQFVIEGHASTEGDANANQSLSQLRAEQIVSVLTSLGVADHCLIPVGFGETQARFPETSPDALLKQDRRVLIFRLDR